MLEEIENDASKTEAIPNAGTSMRTISGKMVDYLDPQPDQILLGDIIRGLSRQPRYVGHTATDETWTVADHLVLCVALARHMHPDAPAEFFAAVFLHDAPESFTADLPSPFKNALKVLGAYDALKTIEKGLDRAIHLKFGIPYPLPEPWPAMIKEIDQLSFRIEESHFRPDPVEAHYLPSGLKFADLPRPVASDMERTLRTVNCWQQIMAERIKYDVAVIEARPKSRPTAAMDF
jgi:5'-deoxynucleotidase YfbR-like HD superfamily hydrolase